MSIEIRPITPEEFDQFVTATFVAFGTPVARPEETEGTKELCEYDRTLAAFDGDEIVGTTGIFSFEMTVPGGSLPAAGVTWVSVKPTHRRRGVLTDVMRRQLSDVRDRGEPIAALWASESLIYGRFGYGLASEGVALKIDRLRTGLAHEPPACGRMRLLTRDQALESWPAIYDRVLPAQPGMYTRGESWWKNHSMPERDERGGGGFSGRFYVQYEEDGEPLGYARYRVRGGDEDGAPNSTVGVQELIAATDGAYAGLWSYLFGIDLVATIQARHRRIDEPLFWMLADPRRLVRSPHDALWLRVVDVPAALEGRRYARQGKLVLEIKDAFCPWTEGRYELETGADGARCKTTDADPDITLGIADLGAVLLGGNRLSTLSRAGRVQGDSETLRRGDAMFAWDPLPWCPEVF